MRRAFVAAAALALAACKLDYEGAPCASPGATAECPTGQRCGIDKRCSTRAAACAAFCIPGVGGASSPKRCSPTAAAIETCTSADPVCGAWGNPSACGTDLACAGGAAPACVCAAPGTELRVDAAAPTDANLAPSGADSPAACRFKRLGDALAAASTWLDAHPAPQTLTVRALGAPASGSPVTFEAESFPLLVPDRAILTTSAAAPTPADWVISAPATALDLVQVEGGGTLEGFTVQTTVATGSGVATSCPGGNTSPATIKDVVVSGGGTLGRGIVVGGTCGAVLQRVDVSGASTAALDVSAPSTAPLVTVSRGSFHGSAVGIRVSGGTLALQGEAGTPSDASANGGAGIAITGAAPAIVALNDSHVATNGGAGVSVSSSADVELSAAAGAQITGNGGDGIALAGTGAVTASLTGAAVGGSGGAGIRIGGPANVTVDGGQVSTNAQPGIVVSGDGAVALALTNGVQVSGSGGAVALGGGGTVDVTLSGALVSAPGTADAIAIAMTGAGAATLGGTAQVTGGRNGISITHAGSGAVSVSLGDAAQVSGAAGSGDGIAVANAGSGAVTVSLAGAKVTGRGQNGIAITNGGTGTVTVALVRNATSGTNTELTLNGASGVAVGGSGPVVLTLSDVPVTGNAGSGIAALGTGKLDLALANAVVSGNGGTGIVVGGVPTTSSLTMTGCSVHSNATILPTQYGSPLRNAGGLLLAPQGRLGTFDLQSNQIYANPPTAGSFAVADQLVFASGTGWVLNVAVANQCSVANAIGCLRPTAYSVSVVDPGTVDARYTTWPPINPAAGGFVNVTLPCPDWTAACP